MTFKPFCVEAVMLESSCSSECSIDHCKPRRVHLASCFVLFPARLFQRQDSNGPRLRIRGTGPGTGDGVEQSRPEGWTHCLILDKQLYVPMTRLLFSPHRSAGGRTSPCRVCTAPATTGFPPGCAPQGGTASGPKK